MAKIDGNIKAGKSKAELAGQLEDLFGDNPEPIRQLVEGICQEYLEAEITRYLGVEPYERSEHRNGHRNGYKPRTLNTRIGQLHFQVPQSRDGKFHPELFQRYQRSEKALRLTLMEMVLKGVTTRKIERVTEVLCGTSFSASMVSQLCQEMDEQLAAFRNRQLTGEYPYIIIDARYEKVRRDGEVVSSAVLMIIGVNEEGYREVLAVEVTALESESTWGDIFRRLKERGLKGVRLVVSDDHIGLKNAVMHHFTGCRWQRCRVHFLRNACGKVSPKDRKELIKILQRIWERSSRQEAQTEIRMAADIYRTKYPAVAQMLEEEIEDTFAISSLPEEHRKRLTTTNALERVSQTIKSRTRLVRIFPNQESCLRLVTALLQELHEDWITGHKYLTMPESEWPERESEKIEIERETVLAIT